MRVRSSASEGTGDDVPALFRTAASTGESPLLAASRRVVLCQLTANKLHDEEARNLSLITRLLPAFPRPHMECRNVSFELRNGHGDGHTDVAFGPDACSILTAGSDGECRLWQKEDEFQDCESFPVGSAVFAVAVQVVTASATAIAFSECTFSV